MGGRHTAFRYCLDPTVEQQTVPARHAGAARSPTTSAWQG
ncbi:helix-turn-helix domain-containing protein [Nocardia sp. NPDC050799]